MRKLSFTLPLCLVALSAPALADPLATAQKAGCMACHAADRPLVGPSYKNIAARYKGQADAATGLADKVRKGGVGVWGKVPMPPNLPARVSDQEIKDIVGWILQS